MGCGGSKAANDSASEPRANIDIDVKSLEKAQQQQQQIGGDSLRESQRLTASGYASDLGSDRPAFTQAFVHNHAGRRAVRALEQACDSALSHPGRDRAEPPPVRRVPPEGDPPAQHGPLSVQWERMSGWRGVPPRRLPGREWDRE